MFICINTGGLHTEKWIFLSIITNKITSKYSFLEIQYGEMGTLIFGFFILCSFQKCIVWQIPKKIQRMQNYEHSEPDYILFANGLFLASR